MSVTKIQVPVKAVDNKNDSTELLQIHKTYDLRVVTRGDLIAPPPEPLDEFDVLEFQFDDDSLWICDPESLDELFPEATEIVSARDINQVFVLPSSLTGAVQQRGGLKNVLLKGLKIFKRNTISEQILDGLALPNDKESTGEFIKKKARDLELKLLGSNSGLYKLDRKFNLETPSIQNDGKYLLLIHGTAASTQKSFGDLRPKPGDESNVWKYIFDTYKDNVLAFEHESLTKSPLENVRDLVKQLPHKVTLDLLSQSRGGLIGDILCRFCIENSSEKGFSGDEKNFLRKAGRLNEISLIEEIEAILQVKNISIGKFIRVACPANGSTLASKRIDVFLNVIFNLIGVALEPATELHKAFKDLIVALIAAKDDPILLPGLEVQNPQSPINRMLNNFEPKAVITTPLMIISGNNRFGFKWQAIKTVLAKLFFLNQNDLIVNTDSMYNGAKRAKGSAQYFFDNSPDVSHFDYFKNSQTRAAILLALKHEGNSTIPGFFELENRGFTPEEIRSIGLNLPPHGEVFRNEVSGKKPIVVLLPGIMGSNLTVNSELVWINYLGFVKGRLASLKHSEANNKKILATSLIGSAYKKLVDFLIPNYDVVTFPFDWRLKTETNAAALNSKLVDLLRFNQPIKLVGHSLGGVVIRDFIINHDETWNALNENKDFRVLFLGSPLGGSFRIAKVLFGEDSSINTLAMLDLDNSRKELFKVFSQFPGIISLLPIDSQNKTAYDFAKTATWESMRKGYGDDQWPVPDENMLKIFGDYRDKVVSSDLDYSKVIYIAGQSGKDEETISGYEVKSKETFFGKRHILEFLATKEGDESVTWDSGIPLNLSKKGKVYFSDVEHGELANDEKLFPAIVQVLQTGATDLLKKDRPKVREAEKEFKARGLDMLDLSSSGVASNLLGLRNNIVRYKPSEVPLAVTVSNGHLKYAKYPLLIGHFENDGIVSAEKVVDNSLDGELARRLRLGVYPGPIGSSKSVLTGSVREFKGAIVVGLGKQGKLNAFQLVNTIEQGISNYLVDLISKALSEKDKPEQKMKTIGISALIVGSGYGGLGIEAAVRAVLQGIQNANQKIMAAYPETSKTIEAIEFIEIYRDRALTCVKAVTDLEGEESRSLNLTRTGNSIKIMPGRRDRMPVDDTREWWTRIIVEQRKDKAIVAKKRQDLRFAISTDAARVDEASLSADSTILFQLLNELSEKENWSAELAKVIFEMLIPNDFKEQVKRQNNISWQLDELTAAFPWELLQDSTSNAKPLSINAGMIRQMVTTDFRRVINSVTEPNALVIADPELENSTHQLPGALREGTAVAELLRIKGYDVSEHLRESPAKIMIGLLGKNYKIVHLAGHGVFEFGDEKYTGMVIGKDSYLIPDDINKLSGVPELVFVNCCYLGKIDPQASPYNPSRYRLASNIGGQLIRIGVKAVVVAGWAVNDAAALVFAEQFYQEMFDGNTFGEAVKSARQTVYQDFGDKTNTWGAYQCYGDPFYRLHDQIKNTSHDYVFVIPEEAEIELSNLLNQLETGDYDVEEISKKMNGITAGLQKADIKNGRVIELQALIYSGLGLYKEANEKFEQLKSQEKASFSFSVSERYCNNLAKLSVQEVKMDGKNHKKAVDQFKKIETTLTWLLDFGVTNERMNILASSYLRLAVISKGKEKKEAYKNATVWYSKAYNNVDNKEKFYPLMNWLAIENALVMAGGRPWGPVEEQKDCLPTKEVAITWIKEEIIKAEQIDDEDMTYWDWVAKADLQLCLLLLEAPDVRYEDVLQTYIEAWKFTGHEGNRRTELEYLDCLEDAYGIAGTVDSKRILELIGRVRRTLEGVL